MLTVSDYAVCPGMMGTILKLPAPLPDCFVAAFLAMTGGGRFFVTSFLRGKGSFLVDVELSNRLFSQADYFTDNSNYESDTITEDRSLIVLFTVHGSLISHWLFLNYSGLCRSFILSDSG